MVSSNHFPSFSLEPVGKFCQERRRRVHCSPSHFAIEQVPWFHPQLRHGWCAAFVLVEMVDFFENMKLYSICIFVSCPMKRSRCDGAIWILKPSGWLSVVANVPIQLIINHGFTDGDEIRRWAWFAALRASRVCTHSQSDRTAKCRRVLFKRRCTIVTCIITTNPCQGGQGLWGVPKVPRQIWWPGRPCTQ